MTRTLVLLGAIILLCSSLTGQSTRYYGRPCRDLNGIVAWMVPGTAHNPRIGAQIVLGNSEERTGGWGQVWVVGSSDRAWGSIRLPMPLPMPIFFPECELAASMDLLLPGSTTSHFVHIPLPNDSSLVGMRLYFQQLFFVIVRKYDRVVGLSYTTDAAEVVIGR